MIWGVKSLLGSIRVQRGGYIYHIYPYLTYLRLVRFVKSPLPIDIPTRKHKGFPSVSKVLGSTIPILICFMALFFKG